MSTINHQDYKNPKFSKSVQPVGKLDSFFLRASHFAIGDKSQNPLEQYATTYNTAMNPKFAGKVDKIENHNFKSSIILSEDNPNAYNTESSSKLIILF